MAVYWLQSVEFIGNNLPEVSNVTVLRVINLREVVYRYFFRPESNPHEAIAIDDYIGELWET